MMRNNDFDQLVTAKQAIKHKNLKTQGSLDVNQIPQDLEPDDINFAIQRGGNRSESDALLHHLLISYATQETQDRWSKKICPMLFLRQ